jgi:enoyl-CoA hydratase
MPLADDMFDSLRIERLDDLLRVRIDNPRNRVNAVDGELHRELAALMAELKRDQTIRAVILTGNEQGFSAGGDFSWIAGLESTEVVEVQLHARQLLWDLLDIEVPLIAAVNGPALGFAATIALLCDAIFMAEDAWISDPHVRIGLVAGDGGCAIWPLALGPALAKRYLLTGDRLEASDALRLGLVTHVVPAAELQDEAVRFARRLMSGPPLAIRYTKLAVNQYLRQTLLTAFDYSLAMEATTLRSADAREAIKALRDHREPEFRGV